VITLRAPRSPVHISLHLPGSKSLSNRYLILDEAFGRKTTFDNLSDAGDTRQLLDALAVIRGKSRQTINTGDAGSTFRFLLSLLAVKKGQWRLDGSARMRERPVSELVNALRQLGAGISYAGEDEKPPLDIIGGSLKGGEVRIDAGISSQFISALLLVSPLLENGINITLERRVVSGSYINMTLALLKDCGMEVNSTGNIISVKRQEGAGLPPRIGIESDWSAASYWYSACALSEEARITMGSLKRESLQGDAVLERIYDGLGVNTACSGETVTLTRKPCGVEAFEFDFSDCPDIAQTVAVTCAGLGITARLTGLGTLKVKETDRIVALKRELEKCGCRVTADSHSLSVHPGRLPADCGPILTYGDHRMAMSFAPLSLRCESLTIDDPDVVGKSYPAYWDHLRRAGFQVNLQPD
jgi:3-phosphoshikimate 1-carboxyvinyltransferase